jgi:hypothetical protein
MNKEINPMKTDLYRKPFRAVQGSECMGLNIVYFLWPRSREVGGILSETHTTLGEEYIPY